jgi:flagellar basal-body rod protein FlgF
MNGAAARLEQLDSVSDNLANAQTPGFKASRPAFEAFLAKADTNESPKIYPAAVGTQIDLRPGSITQTGNPLDILPTGRSFIGVQTSGGIALTRDGHITVAPDGTLTASGMPLIDRLGNPLVAPPNTTVRFDTNGAVFANDVRLGEVALFDAAGPLDRAGPTLLVPKSPEALVASEDGLRLGEVEMGNANPLEATVQLVASQRHFETSMQALQTYKRLDERASEIGRLR